AGGSPSRGWSTPATRPARRSQSVKTSATASPPSTCRGQAGGLSAGASAAFAGFEEAGDLGDLLVDRALEPVAGHAVVEPPEGPVAQVHGLDVAHAGAAVRLVDLEPRLELLRHPV